MKARGTLFMALPNKDQLKFHSYQDAKLLMKAIKKRYGGNKESKKLEIQGEVIKQEDINLNLLRSLPSEWKTHALIWRNKAEIETITLDDLYNNLKIYKPELTGSSSTGQNLQKVAFVSSNSTNSTSSTNEADNTAYGVSTAHIQDIYTKNLQKAEKERDELKLTLEKYQNSSKSLNTLLESQVSDKVKTGLGYKVASLVEKSFVKSSKMLENQDNVKSRSDKEYHTVSPPYIGNYIQPKPDLIFIDKQVESESVDVVSIVSSSVVKTVESKVKTVDKEYKEKGVIDIGCSRHMTRNKCYLTEYEDYDGGFISFGDGKGRISGKGKIKTGTLDFDDVYFYKELKKDNIYSVDLKSLVPTGGLTCLFAKATTDESNLWHMRLGTSMNKLVRGNLVRGLPSNFFENNHGCVACQKGKQHKASYKAKLVNSISKPLHMLHMDLFGPTNVKSLMKKSYCLVITDDFSRFSWVFFLTTKDETSGILKTFITGIENQLDSKVKVIRSDNGTEFKNSVMNQFCDMKRIKREFSVARTPQQNVNTDCYVLNRALVIKPHNKTPYELIRGRPPLIDFIKHFGYLVTILNTRDYLGKFDKKANEGFFVGCSEVSKAMRVFNKRTRIVEETLNIRFLENAPNVKGNRSDWLFDIDSLTISINYVPVVTGFQTNGIAGTKDNIVADESQVSDNGRQDDQVTRSKFEGLPQQASQTKHINSTNSFNTISSSVNTAGPSFVNAALPSPINAAGTPATMEEEVDINNVDLSYTIPDAPFTKFLKDHPKDQLIGSIETHVQTRNIRKMNKEHGLISSVQKLRRKNHKDFQNYLFACYLSQMEPKKPVQALKDPSWVEIMHDSLLQFKLLHIWTLVNLPKDKWEISTKWVFRNKNDERGIVIKNKARLVAQGHTQEEDKNTPIEPNKALVKDAEAEDVDVHSYRSMIRSLMYLTTSRPDIIFVVYACARMMIAKDGRCFMDKIVVKTGIHLVLLVESSAAKHKLTTAGYVYASCVKQFWTTAKVKKVNDQEEIQALVDKQKVIFTEESIRRDLKFDDPEGTACLLNDTIFAELARIGAKTSAWNEFSSTMASDIIFLANNQKFNFSKYIFDNMVKHLEGGIKFLMFPRFLQVFQNNQVEGMAKDKEICVISSHTKKIFANMRRQGHGFSGNVTPLFETMMKKMKPKRKQRQEAKVDSPSSEVPVKETILTPSSDPLPSGEDSIQLNELMIFYTSLQQQVLNFKKAKIAQAKEIAKLKKRVMKNNVILHIREVLRESE
nr:hypothetical protein [Tanacetum cinerariifolium]